MQESYPQSNTWPYILPGLLLVSLVLAPPAKWLAPLRELYVYAVGSLESEVDDQSEPLKRTVIAFDPEQAANTQANPDVSAGLGLRRASDEDESRRFSYDFAEYQTLDRSSPNSVPIESDVWQPPPNWVPSLIQPLTGDSSVERTKPTRVGIQKPVGNRISTSEVVKTNLDARGDRENGPTQSASSSSGPELAADDGSRKRAEANDAAIVERHGTVDSTTASAQVISTMEHQDASANDIWPVSGKLHQLLEDGVADEVLKDWVAEIQRTLAVIEGHKMTGSASQLESVSRLRALTMLDADTSHWSQMQRQLYSRIRHAAIRRVDVWAPLMLLTRFESRVGAWEQLVQSATSLDARLKSSPPTTRWTDYLTLEQVRKSAQSSDQAQRQLAEQILRRLHSNQLDATQRQFLSEPPFRDLERDLRNAIATAIRPSAVARALENYEAEPTRTRANDVIALLSRWQFDSEDDRYAASTAAITRHYRNANVRVAVSETLINRFVPAYHQYAERIDDTILGAEVRGRNSTLTNLSVQLIPDSTSIRLGLLANGQVQSTTASRKGPVTMFNQGQSTFAAGKELIVNPSGIYVKGTETRATTGNRIIGMRTELDNVPILGWILRNVALQQHDEQRPFLRAEILRRVQKSAAKRIDQEVSRRLTKVEKSLGGRVMQPLRQMELAPRAMETRTTTDRIIVRARLASSFQFGAHTPRPQALADSLMSVQIHQTAANNLIEQLNLHGRRMTLGQLAEALSQRLGLTLQISDEEHKDTTVQFADHHPMEFEFANGQITLTIHLAELDNGKRRWKDFSVRGYYRADVRQLDVELIRDEGIELISDRLRLRDQIALRGIFTKVLAKNTRLETLRKAIQQQPNLRNLAVTQFTIRDGWMALSLGEDDVRLVEKSREHR